jgi:hypothetical protein
VGGPDSQNQLMKRSTMLDKMVNFGLVQLENMDPESAATKQKQAQIAAYQEELRKVNVKLGVLPPDKITAPDGSEISFQENPSAYFHPGEGGKEKPKEKTWGEWWTEKFGGGGDAAIRATGVPPPVFSKRDRNAKPPEPKKPLVLPAELSGLNMDDPQVLDKVGKIALKMEAEDWSEEELLQALQDEGLLSKTAP